MRAVNVSLAHNPSHTGHAGRDTLHRQIDERRLELVRHIPEFSKPLSGRLQFHGNFRCAIQQNPCRRPVHAESGERRSMRPQHRHANPNHTNSIFLIGRRVPPLSNLLKFFLEDF